MTVAENIGRANTSQLKKGSNFNLLAIQLAHKGWGWSDIIEELVIFGLSKSIAIRMAEYAVLGEMK